MHNKYSDYVANKTDAEAIVCRSVTGEDVRLTRADFDSDEEFQKWKSWSDADYKESERRDRAYNDRRLSLSAAYFLSDKELNECFSGELKADEQQLGPICSRVFAHCSRTHSSADCGSASPAGASLQILLLRMA